MRPSRFWLRISSAGGYLSLLDVPGTVGRPRNGCIEAVKRIDPLSPGMLLVSMQNIKYVAVAQEAPTGRQLAY
jgi:hypothetical protein